MAELLDGIEYKRGLKQITNRVAIDKASGVTGWRTHDLRRTLRTGLASLRVIYEVAERAKSMPACTQEGRDTGPGATTAQ